MNISKVKTAFKVADVVLDKEHRIRRIKFNFLDKIHNENGTRINTKILKDDTGRVYLIVSNGIIKKIGGSQCSGGIKTTMSFYQGGLQGAPALRTFGIHILIQEELEKGKKVEIYMITSRKIYVKIKGLFNLKKIMISAYKDMEKRCEKDYFDKEGDFPPWNFQENGKQWRRDIIRKWNAHNARRISR